MARVMSRWRERVPRPCMPAALRPWLTDPGSLTARIVARCERFEVRVLRQALALPHADEAAALGIQPGRRVWLREVLLLADGEAVVHARSLLPRSAARGGWGGFLGVGSRPLGSRLFADPLIRRSPLSAARLDCRDARYHRACAALPAAMAPPPMLWARRSLFRNASRCLLVSETFLPALHRVCDGPES